MVLAAQRTQTRKGPWPPKEDRGRLSRHIAKEQGARQRHWIESANPLLEVTPPVAGSTMIPRAVTYMS